MRQHCQDCTARRLCDNCAALILIGRISPADTLASGDLDEEPGFGTATYVGKNLGAAAMATSLRDNGTPRGYRRMRNGQIIKRK